MNQQIWVWNVSDTHLCNVVFPFPSTFLQEPDILDMRRWLTNNEVTHWLCRSVFILPQAHCWIIIFTWSLLFIRHQEILKNPNNLKAPSCVFHECIFKITKFILQHFKDEILISRELFAPISLENFKAGLLCMYVVHMWACMSWHMSRGQDIAPWRWFFPSVLKWVLVSNSNLFLLISQLAKPTTSIFWSLLLLVFFFFFSFLTRSPSLRYCDAFIIVYSVLSNFQ